MCIRDSIKSLVNFNALNVPLNIQSINYVSKNDIMYGSIGKIVDMNNTYTKCCYSTSNTMKYVKRIGDSIESNDKPVRHLMSIPIMNEKSISSLIKYQHTLLGIIPKSSVYLNTSDHWFDIEQGKIMNKYPIAICLFYNEASLLVNPIEKHHFQQIEDSINKNLIPRTCKPISLPDPPLIEHKQKILSDIHQDKDIIFTDASIKLIDEEQVSSIGVWYGPDDVRNLSQKIISEYSNDINYCELVAIYIALINSNDKQKVVLYTDSLIALKLINDGLTNETSIKNIKYKSIISKIVTFIDSRKENVHLMKVKAHKGYIGNENADTMARMGLYKDDELSANNLNDLYRKCRIGNFNKRLSKLKDLWF